MGDGGWLGDTDDWVCTREHHWQIVIQMNHINVHLLMLFQLSYNLFYSHLLYFKLLFVYLHPLHHSAKQLIINISAK